MYENNEILGIKGLPSENLHAGVGYVIIPKNVDPEVYKEDVYRSGRISIYGGYGHSNFYNILVDRDVLQRIIFPKKVGEMGTPVVWVNIPKHNEPIVIAALKYDEDFHSLSERRYRITKEYEGNIVDLDMDGKKARMTLNVTSNNKTKSQFIINIGGVNADGLLKVKVNGKIWVQSTDDAIVSSQKLVGVVVTNTEGVIQGKMVLNALGLTYQDIFKNSIVITEQSMNFRADGSKKINFGDGSEKAILGNTLLKIMERYDDAGKAMTFNTAFGPTSTRINESAFAEIRKDFETILSKLVNLD